MKKDTGDAQVDLMAGINAAEHERDDAAAREESDEE
jgi:hypothetical protein